MMQRRITCSNTIPGPDRHLWLCEITANEIIPCANSETGSCRYGLVLIGLKKGVPNNHNGIAMSCIFNPRNNELWWVMTRIITPTKGGKLLLVSLWYITKPLLVSDAFFQINGTNLAEHSGYSTPKKWYNLHHHYSVTTLNELNCSSFA